MSTLENIKTIITQIIQETDVHKPDLFCSENVFDELSKRPDCQIHPTQKDTVVMLPNVYWSKDTSLTIPNIIANTHKGSLIVQYLELVSHLIFNENGSIEDVKQIIKELMNRQTSSE